MIFEKDPASKTYHNFIRDREKVMIILDLVNSVIVQSSAKIKSGMQAQPTFRKGIDIS